MKVTEGISSSPIAAEKSVRPEEIKVLTTCRAGKIVPVAFVPVLREDRVSRSSLKLKFEMAETVYPLMNAVNVTAFAHFLPWSAFARFNGLDEFNRSYQGIPEAHNGTVIPFFPTINFDRAAEIWKTMGVHWKQGQPINQVPIEAYNLLVNWRRKTRSTKLAARTLTDTTLAPAFWKNPNMWHIVPDFDQAMQDGEVLLSVNNARMPIKGLGIRGSTAAAAQTNTKGSDGSSATVTGWRDSWNNTPATAGETQLIVTQGATAGMPEIYAELQAQGLRLSLSNIELAKKTVAFAKLREQYAGLSENHLIDLLMEGIRVPDEALRQPILLDRKSTIFGYTERHAMDGANLKKSVTTGLTELVLNFQTPAMNTGGIVLFTVEIVPEQLFERQRDHFLGITDPAKLPNFLRDYLDPEKVEVVQNQHVDVEHSTPTGTFGFAPLNHAWKRSLTHIGGRYYRPNPDTFVEDRQRFWSVEQLNPALTSDFYMVGTLPHTVFADSALDPFEILALGSVEIVGNTVFGGNLEEKRNDYAEVSSEVDTTKIIQP